MYIQIDLSEMFPVNCVFVFLSTALHPPLSAALQVIKNTLISNTVL